MLSRRRTPVSRACSLLAGVGVLIGVADCAKKKPPPPPPLVGVVAPISADVSGWDEAVGRFLSIQAVDVRPRVSGYITEIGFKDGQDVEKGRLLFVIDPRPYEATLARARATLHRQEATLATAQVELRRARALLLAQATTQQEEQRRLEDAQQAAADVENARAEVRAAALNVSFTHVRAAVSGRVSDRKVNPGNLVTADQTLLTSIVTLDPIRFAFELPESVYLAYDRSGNGGRDAPVQVRLQDEAGYPHRGRVEFIDNQVSTNAGTIRGRAVLPNPDRKLMPGMFGQLRITDAKPKRAVLVPDDAISQDQDRSVVLLVDPQGKVQQREVTTGPLVGAWRVVVKGVIATDQVVVAGRQKAKPGQKVRVQHSVVPLPTVGAGSTNESYAPPAQDAGIIVAH